MNRNIVEQYLGRYVEIMLMPDGRKTSGLLLRCEEDFFALGSDTGEAFYVYPMLWGINPIDAPQTAQAPAPVPVTVPVTVPLTVKAPAPVPVQVPAAAPVTVTVKAEPEVSHSFLEEIDECYDDIDAKIASYVLNTDYVKKFRVDRMDKIQNSLASILTKYSYAVSVHEDRPYSMRMRQILEEAKTLWRNNQSNIAASEIYGFVLYLMSENAKSVKIYMGIRDFRAAFMASTTAPSRMLAAACLIVSEPLTPKNFAVLLKLEPPQVSALLRWIMTNAVLKIDGPEDHRQMCFRCLCAVSWKMLGFNLSSMPEKNILFSEPNINALKDWLEAQPSDMKIIEDALRLSQKTGPAAREDSEKIKRVDWKTQRFEGEFDYFNPNRDKLYGFIKCPILKRFNVNLRSEGSVFVHINQVEDRALRRKLLVGGKMKPGLRVTFRLGNNIEGPAAYDVKEKNDKIAGPLSVDVMSALSEEGEIDFFARYNTPPFGKIKAKSDKNTYSFNEKNITDPVLAVFLEVDPSPENHPVRFTKSMNTFGKVQIQNVVSAAPFPEEKVKAWEESGLIKKARERLNLDVDDGGNKESEQEDQTFEAEMTPELEEIISRPYVPLEIYTPETKGLKYQSRQQHEEGAPKKSLVPETFRELPKFLQDKIIRTSTAGRFSNQYLTDTYYAKGHFKEVKANYLSMVGRFNNDDVSLTNAEKAERCFIMARYVYNFFFFAESYEKKQYPLSEEDNIRIMAYKGLEYLLYSQLDGAKKNEANYDTARRYCLLKIADEIQETRRIDENNEWLRIYIYSYFVNGLRFHSSTGKWSAQNVSLSGYSILEFNDFSKFFDGLLTLGYLTGGELLTSTLKALLHSPEYSGSLLSELGLDSSVYSKENVDAEISASFQKALDGYGKRKDVLIVDAEVKLSPELLRILSIQKMIVKLMKNELTRILKATPETLDDALRKANPILGSEEYMNSLAKTKRKYNPDAGLLDVLPINVLGAVMRHYWIECFGKYFGGKPYLPYWKEKFAKLQWVRDPVFHAHPEYIKNEDIEEVKAVCNEIAECLNSQQ
ncbi:MAG: hypothetical protein IJP85_02270 [Synergistaceae bacterium]|nr:hypothetical protein [Synergistaceae bacterium]